MSNPFLSPKAFNPDLAAKVAEAYERNHERGLTVDPSCVDKIGVNGLASRIKADTAGSKSRISDIIIGVDQILDPDTRRAFLDRFTETERLFARLDMAAPTVEQCIDAGVDLPALAAAYERMQCNGLSPEIVLSPQLELSGWLMLYENFADDPIVNDDKRIEGGGLFASHSVKASWHKLTAPPDGIPVILAPSCGSDDDGMRAWNLRLIPGTPKPTMVNVNHSYNGAVHPTVSEYLSLQAVRLQAHQEPIDSRTHTWLNSDCSNSSGAQGAVCGDWDEGGGVIYLQWRELSYRRSYTGARLPEWE